MALSVVSIFTYLRPDRRSDGITIPRKNAALRLIFRLTLTVIGGVMVSLSIPNMNWLNESIRVEHTGSKTYTSTAVPVGNAMKNNNNIKTHPKHHKTRTTNTDYLCALNS